MKLRRTKKLCRFSGYSICNAMFICHMKNDIFAVVYVKFHISNAKINKTCTKTTHTTEIKVK